MTEEVKAEMLDCATNQQIERANAAVTANLNDDGLPKYGSAFGYACALTAIMQTDTRTPATEEMVKVLEEALPLLRQQHYDGIGQCAACRLITKIRVVLRGSVGDESAVPKAGARN